MKFLRRYFSWLLTLPLLLAVLGFAVGNRHPTIVNLWPFGINFAIPIYMLALAPLGAGLLLGAGMQWLGGLRHRLAAQRLGREIAGFKSEIAVLRGQLAQRRQLPPPTPEKAGFFTALLRGKQASDQINLSTENSR